MKKVAISQSNYIPWRGYFDLINRVDEFILYDDMQYTRRDWRNRNKIKTPQGLKWLSIAVQAKGNYLQKINQIKISDKNWAKKHWALLEQNYSKAQYFHEYKDVFENLYFNCNEEFLSQINYKFIVTICKLLGIETKIRFSSEFELTEGKTQRLLAICKECDADVYLSGPSAKEYFNEELAKKLNIEVEWMDYSSYGEYNQLFGAFTHNVTVLDLIFNEGKNAKRLLHDV